MKRFKIAKVKFKKFILHELEIIIRAIKVYTYITHIFVFKVHVV